MYYIDLFLKFFIQRYNDIIRKLNAIAKTKYSSQTICIDFDAKAIEDAEKANKIILFFLIFMIILLQVSPNLRMLCIINFLSLHIFLILQ